MKSETFREAKTLTFFDEKPKLFRFLGIIMAIGAWIAVLAIGLAPIVVGMHFVIKFW